LLVAELSGDAGGAVPLAKGGKIGKLSIRQAEVSVFAEKESLQQLVSLEIGMDDVSCDLSQLRALGNLLDLRVVGSGAAQGEWKSEVLGDLRSLRFLGLYLNNIRFSLAPLARLSQLIGLSLEACNELDDLSALRDIRHLRYLSLVGVGEGLQEGSSSILRDLRNLESLNLSYASKIHIVHLRDLANLKFLDLTNVYLEDEQFLDEVVAGIRNRGGIVVR
jgi:Leucine-rich repeat (LRR) protein